MRQYLLYSGSAHALAFSVLFLVIKPGRIAPPSSTYSIDFIGPSGIATVGEPAKSGPEETAQPDKKKGRKADSELTTSSSRKFKNEPLPAPSVLRNLSKNPKPAAGEGVSRDAAVSGVTADFPNFPYPWYVSQVRASLWDEWSSRMPRGGFLSCVLVFRVQRDGNMKKISVEKSSGNKLFDFSAMSAAEQAAPFPPLPADFLEPELVVHVEFRVME